MNKFPSTLTTDLSNYSSPIAGLFEQPQTAKEWKKYMLTEEQVASFQEHGFVSGIKILTEEQVSILNEELVTLQAVNEEEKKTLLSLRNGRSDTKKSLLKTISALNYTRMSLHLI